MKQLLNDLVRGRPFRQRPVALPLAGQGQVRALASAGGGETDVTRALFAVSLSPFLLGFARQAGQPAGDLTTIRLREATSGEPLASLRTEPAGTVAHPDGAVELLRPIRSSVDCIGPAERIWRDALARHHARRQARRAHAFAMRFDDLRAFTVFTMIPRPVYLVSVTHEDAGNLFPMDLLGPLGARGFLLALRLTSPSVETIRASGRIAVSAVPAAWKETAYRLGDRHRERTIAWSALPFAIVPSRTFGIPVPADALGVRELAVTHSEPVGSHMLFAASVVAATAQSSAPQLCHVSEFCARWRAARGEPFAEA
ncbi:MAG TPA: flavin reductase [Croceibacterium sp.]|nr:flavin reductase [Croceibacterium sp.]